MNKDCGRCANSTTNVELEPGFDGSSVVVSCVEYLGYQFSILFDSETPHACPVHLAFRFWDERIDRWVTVGLFVPRYCPYCGRKIEENEPYFERQAKKKKRN